MRGKTVSEKYSIRNELRQAGLAALEQRHERAAVHRGRHVGARQLQQRRSDRSMLSTNSSRAVPGLTAFGIAHEQRDADRFFVGQPPLDAQAVLAVEVAVVAGEDDQRVVELARLSRAPARIWPTPSSTAISMRSRSRGWRRRRVPVAGPSGGRSPIWRSKRGLAFRRASVVRPARDGLASVQVLVALGGNEALLPSVRLTLPSVAESVRDGSPCAPGRAETACRAAGWMNSTARSLRMSVT